MIGYTLKRLVNACVILFVIATATWFLMQLLPGSPFNDEKLSPEARAQIEAKYGLDDPLLVQYVRYIGNLAQGDLGNSYQYSGKPVLEIILERLPVSAFLGAQAVVLGVIGGLLLGVIGALKHNSLADSGTALLAVLGIAVPEFVLAPLAQYWLAFKLGIFPPAFFESWWHSVLPSMVLAITVAAVVATFTRTEMLEVLGQDYITLAKSKGLSWQAVVWRHVLRNSLIPLVTVLFPLMVGIITGSIVIEQIFAVPGIGDLFVRSIFVNDYATILGTTIFFSVLFILAYLIQDILYAVIDPRIRVAGGEE